VSAVQHVVIVGAGQGGFQAAACLRKEGFSGPIVMIGDEPGLPYQRRPLSKSFLKEGDPVRLELRPHGFYERLDIQLAIPDIALEVDRKNRVVRTARGAQHPFHYLILATGSACFSPPIPGATLSGVHRLRSLKDAERLRHSLKTAKRVVVIGGGFIGLEFASVALRAGHDVTVIETSSRLLARAISSSLAHAFAGYHTQSGLRLRLTESVQEIVVDSHGSYSVILDGGRLKCDLVLLATGVRPNISLAEWAGLAIENGVRGTETLQTSDEAIYCLGDCASFPDPFTRQRIRLESVQAATDHARLIARNIVRDQPACYDALPWFWSDQGQWKLQIAGLSLAQDDEVPIERDDGSLVVFRFRADNFVALETVNAPLDHMAARKLLQAKALITREVLERSSFDLRALARAASEGGS
jgi:3-phenylpropionate/trans-cinnamate dioxygenase ferredoxin reductase component